ncbi:hypothetical protein BC829DRAFT_389107 [Chytridium lagenaria]|nr:hypothetical protein BC829DRAFT_389107 [Chytridium lagenaria]
MPQMLTSEYLHDFGVIAFTNIGAMVLLDENPLRSLLFIVRKDVHYAIKYIPQVKAYTISRIVLTSCLRPISITRENLRSDVMDSSVKGDWTGLTGNPVKFGLGLISLFSTSSSCPTLYPVSRRGCCEEEPLLQD